MRRSIFFYSRLRGSGDPYFRTVCLSVCLSVYLSVSLLGPWSRYASVDFDEILGQGVKIDNLVPFFGNL